MSTSKRKRPAFSAEFKAEAVQLVVAGAGRPIAQVARELGIGESPLAYRVKAYRAQHGGSGAPSPVEAARIAALEAENRRLSEEIEVFYNRQRSHSILGYRTPAAVHTAATDPQTATAA